MKNSSKTIVALPKNRARKGEELPSSEQRLPASQMANDAPEFTGNNPTQIINSNAASTPQTPIKCHCWGLWEPRHQQNMFYTRISATITNYQKSFSNTARKSYGTSRLVYVTIKENLNRIWFHKMSSLFTETIFLLKEHHGADPWLFVYLAQVLHFAELY